MFQLKKDSVADQEILTISHPNGESTFSTISSLGASLFKLKLTTDKVSRELFKYWEDPSRFISDYQQRFPGSQLFPFPNRLSKGSYTLDSQTYNFPLNDFGRPNALHGHLHDKSFQLEEWNAKLGVLSLKYSYGGDNPAFPFSYNIKNQFSLTDNSLEVRTEIKNKSKHSIPIGYGWHPYFHTPKKVDNYLLELPSASTFEVDKELIPTGKLSQFDAFNPATRIENMVLDSCLLVSEKGNLVKLIDPEEKSCISLDISQFDYLQVYIPPERDAIALEPQSCAPDAFNNGIGLELLPAEAVKTYTFKISLDRLTQ